MMITTGDDAATYTIQRAQKLAAEFAVPYIKRAGRSIPKLASTYNETDFIVLVEQEVRIMRPGEPIMQFHPSMAYVRAKRLLKGEADPMITHSLIEPGDHVIDCTAGLGSDSLVFSLYTGEQGKVVALESSMPLAALLTEGLRSHVTALEAVNEAMRRIKVIQQDHVTYLSNQPDKSVDVIYFDPMFREAVHQSAAIAPLRGFSNHNALTEEAVKQAIRVARKSVLLKEKWDSPEYERLGFKRIQRKTSKIEYGVIYP
ncbi:16S rRNA (guanine1516-N2)-methyltransferase [Paenibacillus sp. SORGH_AS306]|uniref:class I SAM-dependent methyltransferase n=1 Tax=unclassified Paenibacillus TaxID=185978 RepID=UPI0027801BA9|nr:MULTISPECIES: class I SAM-dependent methyltransferase [unclassified Paenibacillus]MDQ1234531.1 16S rRNA (guanine1516-N2)-methyltransferase [Paenibacillus sp. SORGH_AS_0306]MDR6111578.1 16S rRNA (guanine1516-N2)-methyltransferase [Paenibacillus sp. SORGH_AS_0338]